MTSPLLAPMPERIACASCGADISTAQVVAARDYHCNTCHAELAHLDLAPNGLVRSVLGWLRAPGDVLNDRYRIRGFLGKGGFAATYLVEDQRLNGKRRAAKEIPEIFFDERETEILSRIQHPCVPDITDRFTADGMVYLVLEFGGDRTLETVRVAEGGRVPLAKLRPWIEQLCDALAYLHAQSPPIVHRDLKPANVLLDESDRVMLIDFGIAKEATPDTLTRTVARSASHGFSPPEQVLGTGTDQRSDVYALGATMYALLTGQAPPPAHERVAGSEIVPPRQLVPEISQTVEAAILRALELNVAKRQPSVDEFRRGLGASAAEQSARTVATAPRTIALAGLDFGAAPRTVTGQAAIESTGAAVPLSRPQPGISRGKFLVVGVVVCALIGAVAFWVTRGKEDAAPTAPVVVVAPPPRGPSVAERPQPGKPPGDATGNTASSPSSESHVVPPPRVTDPISSAVEALAANRDSAAQQQPEPPPKRVNPPPIKTPPPARQPASSKHGWDDFQGPTGGVIRKLE